MPDSKTAKVDPLVMRIFDAYCARNGVSDSDKALALRAHLETAELFALIRKQEKLCREASAIVARMLPGDKSAGSEKGKP